MCDCACDRRTKAKELKVAAIDEQAQLLAINRQAIIKMWLKERLDKERDRLAS